MSKTSPSRTDPDRQGFLLLQSDQPRFGIKPDATQRVLKQLMPAIQPKRLQDGTAVYLFENADLPFALFVSGKPVLVGVFTSPFSSTLYPNQITPLSPAIPAQGAHPATFVLRFTPPPQTGNTTPAEQFLQAIKTLGLSSSSPAH